MRYLFYLFLVSLSFTLFSCAGENSSANKPRHGTFKSHYPDGTLELEVRYENGIRVSPLRHFYPSGKLHTEVDTAGNYRQYFEDGTLAMEFTEKNGKKIGDEKIYYSNGNLNSVLKYNDGVCFLREGYFENGVMHSSCKIMRTPKRHEICQTFYKSGKPRQVKGDDGRYTLYHENGNVERDFVYRGDTLVEDRVYYSSGTPKEIKKYKGPIPKNCEYCALETKISYYNNGKIKDSCYIEKPDDWDGVTARGLVRACSQFYENGTVKKVPTFSNAKLVESREYFSSGKLKIFKAYNVENAKDETVVDIRYREDGLVEDSCFRTFGGRMACSTFDLNGKPKVLFSEKDGVLLHQVFYADGNLKSTSLIGADGELSHINYNVSGSVIDSCYRLFRDKDSREICKVYENDGSLKLLQTLMNDTIFEKRYFKGELYSECKTIWKGSYDEESVCKSYSRNGLLNDSTVKVNKKDYSSEIRFGCNGVGAFDRYSENISHRENGLRVSGDFKACKIEKGQFVDCKEEHWREKKE